MTTRLRKNLIDQPLHFVWAFVAFAPWAVWGNTHSIAWAALHVYIIVVREVWQFLPLKPGQWGSSQYGEGWRRIIDPLIDWTFYAAGAVTALVGLGRWLG